MLLKAYRQHLSHDCGFSLLWLIQKALRATVLIRGVWNYHKYFNSLFFRYDTTDNQHGVHSCLKGNERRPEHGGKFTATYYYYSLFQFNSYMKKNRSFNRFFYERKMTMHPRLPHTQMNEMKLLDLKCMNDSAKERNR